MFYGYNLLAPFYQSLSKVVFGNLLIDAQLFFLTTEIKPITILIVGGGSGELLHHCFLQYPTAKITYIESSQKMILESKKRISNLTPNSVSFVHEDVFFYNTKQRFDLIILPFFLDLFCSNESALLLNKLSNLLTNEKIILIIDFVSQPSFFQRNLIRIMYLFFWSLNASKTKKLIKINPLIKAVGLKIIEQKYFGEKWYKKMVISYKLTPFRVK